MKRMASTQQQLDDEEKEIAASQGFIDWLIMVVGAVVLAAVFYFKLGA